VDFAPARPPPGSASAQAARDLNQSNVELQREFKRKEKAPAEAAGRRVPQKIPRAVRGRARMTAAEERKALFGLIGMTPLAAPAKHTRAGR
jgi:hypothetical protein